MKYLASLVSVMFFALSSFAGAGVIKDEKAFRELMGKLSGGEKVETLSSHSSSFLQGLSKDYSGKTIADAMVEFHSKAKKSTFSQTFMAFLAVPHFQEDLLGQFKKAFDSDFTAKNFFCQLKKLAQPASMCE